MESHALSRSLDRAAPCPASRPSHTRGGENTLPSKREKHFRRSAIDGKAQRFRLHTATAHPLIRPTASLRRNASTKRHFLIKPGEYTQQRDFPDCFAAYMAMSLCRTKSSSFVPGSALDAMPILADITRQVIRNLKRLQQTLQKPIGLLFQKR